MNLNELSKLISDHISNEGTLFFPDRIYGGSTYLIDEEDFFGPVQIHTYIVPASFSKSTKKNSWKGYWEPECRSLSLILASSLTTQ